MRPHVRVAVLAIALVATFETARAAPVTATPPLVSVNADRGSPVSFNTSREAAGEIALRLLADDVNSMLRATLVEGEHALIRAAADAVVVAIGDANTADHSVRYAISGSIRESGVRSFSASVESTRIRGHEPKSAARIVEPWMPKAQSPTARSRVQRDGSAASEERSEANAANTSGDQTSTARAGALPARSG